MVMSSSARSAVTRSAEHGYKAAVTDDASLVRASLEGDAKAFTVLIDRHANACLRFATRMLGNVEDAEDVAQETFVRAHRALDSYDSQRAFRTWLMTILVNRCRSAMIARHRRERLVIAQDDVVSAAVAPPVGDPFLREAIVGALARIDPEQREAFLLKHVEQLEYEEMAAITGAGVSALKMRVRRACVRLQGLLAEVRRD
jgi:RNA polymerase sigma-70 factor (ECF subfamily)